MKALPSKMIFVLLLTFVGCSQSVVTYSFDVHPEIDERKWGYFPVIKKGNGFENAPAIVKSVDGPGYVSREISPKHPECLGFPWSFRDIKDDAEVGVVIFPWPLRQAPEFSKARLHVIGSKRGHSDERISISHPRRLPEFDIGAMQIRRDAKEK